MPTSTSQREQSAVDEETISPRESARKRVEMKRKLRADIAAYIIVNAFLVGIWAVSGGGSFWPGWVLAGWGVFLLIDVSRVYLSAPITEADIDKEIRHQR